MDVKAFIKDRALSDSELSERYGLHRTYWSHLRHGSKTPGRAVALRLWRMEGVKLEPLASLSDAEIAMLDRLEAAQ